MLIQHIQPVNAGPQSRPCSTCWDAHFLKMNAAWKIWQLLMRRLSTVQEPGQTYDSVRRWWTRKKTIIKCTVRMDIWARIWYQIWQFFSLAQWWISTHFHAPTTLNNSTKYFARGAAAVAQSIQPMLLNRETSGSNLLATAVVPLGKALNPHCPQLCKIRTLNYYVKLCHRNTRIIFYMIVWKFLFYIM